jgi:hypothetical protein
MSRRRYKVGEHRQYDLTFDRLAWDSFILNPGHARRSEWNFGLLHDLSNRQGLERLLQEWKGNGNGRTLDRHGVEVPSHQLKNKQEIGALQERFEGLNQRRINKGMRPLKEMRSDMLTELYQLEAQSDIIAAEIAQLEKLLTTHVEKDDKTATEKVLRYGPRGDSYSGRPDRVITELDGQHVEPDREGVLRIRDERSPYHGMRVIDYRERVISTFRTQQKQQAAQRLERAQQAAREKGLPLPTRPPAVGGAVRREDLPDWPEGVAKYDWSKGQ